MNQFSELWRLQSGQSFFDKSPEAMKEENHAECSCLQQPQIVTESDELELIPDNHDYTCGGVTRAASIRHFVDITPVIVASDNTDTHLYVNDEAADMSEEESDAAQHDHDDLAEGLNIHWTVENKNKFRHKRRTDEGGENANNIVEGDLVRLDTPAAAHLSDKIISQARESGLTQDKVLTLCSNTVLNSSLAKQCEKYFYEDISAALDICVLGR